MDPKMKFKVGELQNNPSSQSGECWAAGQKQGSLGIK